MRQIINYFKNASLLTSQDLQANNSILSIKVRLLYCGSVCAIGVSRELFPARSLFMRKPPWDVSFFAEVYARIGVSRETVPGKVFIHANNPAETQLIYPIPLNH
jgi:hypothetical protein